MVFIQSAAQGHLGPILMGEALEGPWPHKQEDVDLLKNGSPKGSQLCGWTMQSCSFIMIRMWCLPKRVLEDNRVISSLGGALEMLRFQNYIQGCAI